MKAFHHSGTNLISVWKSGPRTVVLSKMLLYLPFQLQFHIIAQTFFFFFFDLMTFYLHIFFFCTHLPFATYQQKSSQIDFISWNSPRPITLTVEKGKLDLISFSPFIRSRFCHANSLCNTAPSLFHYVFQRSWRKIAHGWIILTVVRFVLVINTENCVIWCPACMLVIFAAGAYAGCNKDTIEFPQVSFQIDFFPP